MTLNVPLYVVYLEAAWSGFEYLNPKFTTSMGTNIKKEELPRKEESTY